MRATLQKRCDLFINNRDIIKSAFKWESAYIYPLCASIISSKGKLANVEKMKTCLDLLKQKTGIFSNFRGTSKMATVTMLSFSKFPEKQIEDVLIVYNELKKVFFRSEYLSITAVLVTEFAKPHHYVQIVQNIRNIYNRMKDAHPFLTSSEDITFAALLALSNLDNFYIEKEIEGCYEILKSSFFSKNAVQSLSHVLALGKGYAEQKCNKVMDIYNSLKNHGYKYGTNYELATLGVLALLDVNIEILVEDMIKVDNFLKKQKGFGAFGVGAKQRLMYAGILTMNDYIPDSGTLTIEVAALGGTVALVIAQQSAMIAAMAATSAAASSSSSS